MRPKLVVDHMLMCLDKLYEKKRWRGDEVVQSLHCGNKKSDRARRVTNASFNILPRAQLVDLVLFDLTENNQCCAVGRLWVRVGYIPLGGPFNAEAADFHSLCYARSVLALGALGAGLGSLPGWVSTRLHWCSEGIACFLLRMHHRANGRG